MADLNAPLLPGGQAESSFVPVEGDRYARTVDPESGNEVRCAINSISGGDAEVQLYCREKDVPKGDPVVVPVYTIRVAGAARRVTSTTAGAFTLAAVPRVSSCRGVTVTACSLRLFFT